jgi:hypothetical protein
MLVMSRIPHAAIGLTFSEELHAIDAVIARSGHRVVQ